LTPVSGTSQYQQPRNLLSSGLTAITQLKAVFTT